MVDTQGTMAPDIIEVTTITEKTNITVMINIVETIAIHAAIAKAGTKTETEIGTETGIDTAIARTMIGEDEDIQENVVTGLEIDTIGAIEMIGIINAHANPVLEGAAAEAAATPVAMTITSSLFTSANANLITGINHHQEWKEWRPNKLNRLVSLML